MRYPPEWRYLPYGKVAHALIADTTRSYCGALPLPRDRWRGGADGERVRLVSLRSCPHCVVMLGDKP